MMMRSKYFFSILVGLSLVGAQQAAAQVRAAPRRPVLVERGWLGFAWTPATVRMNGESRPAAIIEEVVDDSPAERAGLEVGDTIVSINGMRVTERFMDTLAETLEPDDEVRVRVRSGSRERELTLTADERPRDFPFEPRAFSFDFEITPDSLRNRMRIYIDSLSGSLKGMDLPRMRVERRGGGGVFLYRGDSLTMQFHPDSAWRGMRGGVWVMPDSLRMFRDSSFFYALPRGRGRLLEMDSLMRSRLDTVRLRNLQSGRIYGFSGDSVWQFEPGANARYSITMFGGRAIGGAELNELNPDLGEYFGTETGVLIVRVPSGTPAARAGLQAGDVILSINGRDIESMSDLRSAVGRSSREPIRIEILRKRNRQTIELR
jgi:hypothetical protein